jgi:hypothetical protein
MCERYIALIGRNGICEDELKLLWKCYEENFGRKSDNIFRQNDFVDKYPDLIKLLKNDKFEKTPENIKTIQSMLKRLNVI